MSAPPDADAPGRFGPYGGRYVPETLIAALDALEREYRAAQEDPAFRRERDDTLRDFAGRPTPLVEAHRFSASAGCRVVLKREDLLHTGAHKINNTIGQCLLTRRMVNPLNALSKLMHRAEEGESGMRAEPSGPRDLIEMASAFNKMMNVLEQREA